MKRLLLPLCVALLTALAPAQAKPGALTKVYDAWLKSWRKGACEISNPKDVAKESLLGPAGLLRGVLGTITHRKELEILLDKAIEEDSAASVQRVLRTAAAGLDRFPYTEKMAPHIVRGLGEAALSRFKSAAATDAVLQHARERKDVEEGREYAAAVQAAALRALGGYGDPAFRATLEGQLVSADEQLRLAAADGLARLRATASVEPLARVLEKEQKDVVLQGVVSALAATIDKNEKELSPESARLAVLAAISALGRGTWRSDVALVEFLSRFRARESVPALIGVLERFAASLDDVKSGKTSTLLRWRAQETLLALTGAYFPAEKPELWREFWEKQKETFQLAPAKDDVVAAKGGTVTRGFFGIPVQGSRIVWVVDCSGSMTAPIRGGGTTTDGKMADRVTSRMDAAKENLIEAIQALPEEAKFDLVWFSAGVHVYSRETLKTKDSQLMPATAANKRKLIDYVNTLTADGGTNLWGGLKAGLEIKSLVHGSHYESHIDEMFILSDGLPSVGDIIDPDEILRLVTETNRFAKIRINAVYLGELKNDKDRGQDGGPLMKSLAEGNGGKFVRK